MNKLPTSRPIVVGIDDAVSRDVPLRLVYAIERDNTQQADPDAMVRKLATAERRWEFQ